MIYLLWSLMLMFFGVGFFYLGMLKLCFLNKTFIEFILLDMVGVDFTFYLLLDWVSCIFMFVVLFISSMVIFYSYTYMKGDLFMVKFLYLVLLFVISMLLMVLSPSMVMILLGWDGLGLVSYCLVIYYQSEGSNSAGMITVLMNRVGDVGMLLSLVFMLNFGSMHMLNVGLSDSILIFMGGFLMLGAMTKSAQMPFSVWLPAAMAAPTPVSALVHSSTLVTAGVYLVARMNMFFMSDVFSGGLFYISITTMFMAGLSACLEMDLKKIIALSTLSQLGVMMMILSSGYVSLGFFHLFTHAFFKAMLFLCAGAMIYGIGGSQDIRTMGLFMKLSPLVSGLTLLAIFSLSGFPYLSGFYSKDLILELLYLENSNFLMMILLMLATFFTVLYSLRLMFYGMLQGLMFSPFSFYIDFKGLILPIYLMGFMVVFFGCSLSWILFPHPMFLCLSMSVKVMNLFMILLTFLMFIFIFNKKKSFSSLGFVPFFVSTMWFLSKITSGLLMAPVESMSGFSYSIEQGWSEEVGPVGISEWFMKGGVLMSGPQVGFMKPMFFLLPLFFLSYVLF